MNPVYARMGERARRIAARFPPPSFHTDFHEAVALSRRIFETDPAIGALRSYVLSHLENDFGHGFGHAVKVALDAGSLMAIEGRLSGFPAESVARRILLAHASALLHDIRRKEKNHPQRAAAYAGKLLKSYPFASREVADICIAIRNHEAFQPTFSVETEEGAMLSGCLYDADKFRWGPDNFTDTLWEMLSFHDIPPEKFVERYPRGLEKIAGIKLTFRTRTGRIYGPRFIELGLAIGEELYRELRFEILDFRFAI